MGLNPARRVDHQKEAPRRFSPARRGFFFNQFILMKRVQAAAAPVYEEDEDQGENIAVAVRIRPTRPHERVRSWLVQFSSNPRL